MWKFIHEVEVLPELMRTGQTALLRSRPFDSKCRRSRL